VNEIKGKPEKKKDLLTFNSRCWFRDLGSGLWNCSQRFSYLWITWL